MEAVKTKTSQPRTRRRRRLFFILGTILLILVVFRLCLPYVVLRYVNNKLANLKEYHGHVEDIDIALIRGAYVINDINLVKIDSETRNKRDTIPFFSSPEIDLSVDWSALFKGAIAGEIYVEKPVLNFVKGNHKNEDVRADTTDFRTLIKELMPLTINHFQISDGEIHYIDKYSNPKLDVYMSRLNITADNLTNVNDSMKLLPSHVKANGYAYDGKFDLDINLDPFNKQPTFDLNAAFTDINMVKLNDFMKAYGNFDIKEGSFGVYAEFAAKEGNFGGYVKPLVKNLDVVQWNKEEGNTGQILWETVVGTTAEIFQNQRKEQLATEIPINGKFTNPDVYILDAIVVVLRNAFVSALRPAIDNKINISAFNKETKGSTLGKLFTSSKEKEKEKKKAERKKGKREKRKEK